VFAEEGASLILCSRTSEVENVAAQIRTIGCNAAVYRVDVSQVVDVHRMIKDALSNFDRIDILVNNAGIYGPIGQLWKNELEEHSSRKPVRHGELHNVSTPTHD